MTFYHDPWITSVSAFPARSPQIQNYYEQRFGYAELAGMTLHDYVAYVKGHPTEAATRLGSFLFQVLLLPVAAVYPPLSGKQYLDHSPWFRYWANEVSALIFFCLLIASDFSIHRGPRDWPRDYGLMIWTIMQFAHQVHFMFLAGLSTFADFYALTDLAANVRVATLQLARAVPGLSAVPCLYCRPSLQLCCFTALLLNMCNGQEPMDMERLLFSVSGSGYSCGDWPTTGARC